LATISDVAKLAGLSVSTVSRVINDSPHVSDIKRNSIESAMKQLGYVPRPAARQLRGSKTNTMAVTIPRIVNPFFSYLVDAIEQKLDEAGYSTLIVQTFSRAEEELTALNLLKNHQVDGVILCSLENSWSVISQYCQYGKIVLVNEYLKNVQIPMVKADQYTGFYQATDFLFEQGYHKIAYATGRKTISIMERGENFDADRFAGFQDSLNKHKMSFNNDWLFTQAHTAEDGRSILKQISALREKPDVVIAGSDEVALGVLQEAEKLKIKVPEEIAVLGVDDQPLAADLRIPLTTVRQPVKEMGQGAAETMIDIMSDNEDPKDKVYDLKVIKRASA